LSEKILIVGAAHPLRGGGISTFNQVLAAELQKSGHEVRILTFTLQYPSFLFQGKSQYTNEPAPPNLNIDVMLNSVNPFNWFKVGRHYKKWKPDLVIFRYWTPFMAPAFGTIARIIKRNRQTKIIAITDNVIPHERSMADKPFTAYFLAACDGFVTMSQSVLSDLMVFNKTKPRAYHPHPLYNNFGEPVSREAAIEKLELDPQFQYILFFGFIRKYKGLDLLLQAFADERLRKFKVKLIVAGEYYENPKHYEEIIAHNNLRDWVVLHINFIPDNEVRYFFSAADLITQTYRHATQSGVTQIAYHFGKPLLVTNVGGLAELVPNKVAGYVVEPRVLEIADALYDFFSENRLAAFTVGATDQKKRFTWEGFIEAIFEVFNASKALARILRV
jgi:glycosyltransferase involved in cell wall biosynthesis